MEHAKCIFERLGTCMLGRGAVAPNKLQHGLCLRILGLDISCTVDAFCCVVSADKAAKWLAQIEQIMLSQTLAHMHPQMHSQMHTRMLSQMHLQMLSKMHYECSAW